MVATIFSSDGEVLLPIQRLLDGLEHVKLLVHPVVHVSLGFGIRRIGRSFGLPRSPSATAYFFAGAVTGIGAVPDLMLVRT